MFPTSQFPQSRLLSRLHTDRFLILDTSPAVADFSCGSKNALLRRALSRPRLTAKEQACLRSVTVDRQCPPLRKFQSDRAFSLRCALLVAAGTEAWRTGMFSALVATAMSGSTCPAPICEAAERGQFGGTTPSLHGRCCLRSLAAHFAAQYTLRDALEM